MAVQKTPKLKMPTDPKFRIDRWMPEYQGKPKGKTPVRRGVVKQTTKKV